MIVDDVLGAAEYDVGQAFGCPFHGLVENGTLTLPGGQTLDYPQPTGGLDSGRTLLIKPDWAPGGTTTTEQTTKGFSWEKYAVIGGENGVLHGQELGKGCWLWAEAPGKVWKVDASALTLGSPLSREGQEVSIHLTRFGWIGSEPPDGELERTITVLHPIFSDLPTTVANPINYLCDYRGVGLAAWTCSLADTHPTHGGQALFMAALGLMQPGAVFLLDLVAGTLELFAGLTDAESVNQATDFSYKWFEHATLVTESVPYDCNGDIGKLNTSTYQVTDHQWPPVGTLFFDQRVTSQGIADSVSTSRVKIIIGTGFDASGNPQVMYAQSEVIATTIYTYTETYGGEQVTGPAACVTPVNTLYFDNSALMTKTSECTFSVYSSSGQVVFQKNGTSVNTADGTNITQSGTGLLGDSVTKAEYVFPYRLGNNAFTMLFALLNESHADGGVYFGVINLGASKFVAVTFTISSVLNNYPQTMDVLGVWDGSGRGIELDPAPTMPFRTGYVSIHPVTGELRFNTQADGPCCYV